MSKDFPESATSESFLIKVLHASFINGTISFILWALNVGVSVFRIRFHVLPFAKPNILSSGSGKSMTSYGTKNRWKLVGDEGNICENCQTQRFLIGINMQGLTKTVSNNLVQVAFSVEQADFIGHLLGQEAWSNIFVACLTIDWTLG